jgi:hypothetical protein
MADIAQRDENRVTTLLGVSNVDGTSTVNLYADPVTHRLLTQNSVTSGVIAPASTPSALGQMYIDTALAKVYVSTGTASSADWTILN